MSDAKVTIRECSSQIITGEHGGPPGVGVGYCGALGSVYAYGATIEEAIGNLVEEVHRMRVMGDCRRLLAQYENRLFDAGSGRKW